MNSKLRVVCICIISAVLSCPGISMAQHGNPTSAGALGLAMGDIKSIHLGPENCFANPANNALAQHSSISAFVDNRYFINQLFGAYAGGTLAMKDAGFSIDLYNYGWDKYSESSVGLAYGRKLMKNLSLGLRFKMYNFNIQDYGQQNTYALDIGLNQKINDQLMIGFILSNPVKSELTEDRSIQSAITLGLAYFVNERFTAALEFFKEEDFDLEAKLGFDYQFIEKVGLQMGYQSNAHQFSFGLRISPVQTIDIALSSSLHPTLGISTSAGVNYLFR